MRRVSSLSAADDAFLESQIEGANHANTLSLFADLVEIREQSLLPHIADWCLEFLPHYFTLAPSKLHLAITDKLHEVIRPREAGLKEAILAPRSGAKTTWCSKAFPLYCICHDMERYIILVGDTTEQSQQNLEAVKHELGDNEALAEKYPHACGYGSVWNQDQIVTRNGVKVQALGAGKAFRGRSFRQHRPGLVIVDDLDNDEAVMTENQRAKMWTWFTKALIPIGTQRTSFFVIGTALHRDDTIHRLKKSGGWQFHLFQGLVKEPTERELWDSWRLLYSDLSVSLEQRQRQAKEFYAANEVAMNAGAEVLWPEMASLYSLMEYRASYGESAFLSEYQGVPTAALAAEWPPEVFGPHIWFDRWPECLLTVIALDPSKGKTDHSDYSAFAIVGVTADGVLYVEADIKRRDTTRIIEDAFTLYHQHRPADVVVEVNQFQELLAVEFERQAVERQLVIPVTGVSNSLNKQTRIRMIGPYLRQGKFRFKAGSRDTELLVDQLREFPYGSHDDGPDALQMAVKDIERLLADFGTE